MRSELPKPAIWGKQLELEIHEQPTERKAIVEGLIYEKSVIMCSADPGVGKSVLVANIIASVTSGVPLFGTLNVPEPAKVYYIPFERGKEEIYERLKMVAGTVKLNYDYIFINDEFIGYNVNDPEDAMYLMNRIKSDTFGVKLVILDPIYSSVAGGLSTDEKASQFVRFSARIQKELECAIWMNHHNVKDSYDIKGKKIDKTDPFYGSVWLKAHCTGAYTLKRINEQVPEEGVKLSNKKDAHSNLIREIELGYNPEDYTLFTKSTDESMDAMDRVKIFLRNKWRINDKTFLFSDLITACPGAVTRHLRRILCHTSISDSIKKQKINGKKTLYTLIKEL